MFSYTSVFVVVKSHNFLQDSYIEQEPRRLLRSKAFTKAAIGSQCTFALTSKNELFAWGVGFSGDKNAKEVPVKEPIRFAADIKVESIAAGPQHYALIDTDGQVHTWGHGGSWMSGGGQLGHGTAKDERMPK
jgi:alpha-tubulin suppressor-like RCC1 family protein